MNICRGLVNGKKCVYFDDTFEGCNHPKRSNIIKEDLQTCVNFTSADKVVKYDVIEDKIELADDLVLKFVKDVNESDDESDHESYKNFLTLNPNEQQFVFKVAVEKLKSRDAIRKLYPEMDKAKVIAKARYLMSKPKVINALEEFSISTQKLLAIKGSELQMKALDKADEAFDSMIEKWESGETWENGYEKVNEKDIIMAGKLIGDTVSKFKQTNQGDGNVITLTFGDNKKLHEIIGELGPRKEIVIEESD